MLQLCTTMTVNETARGQNANILYNSQDTTQNYIFRHCGPTQCARENRRKMREKPTDNLASTFPVTQEQNS